MQFIENNILSAIIKTRSARCQRRNTKQAAEKSISTDTTTARCTWRVVAQSRLQHFLHESRLLKVVRLLIPGLCIFCTKRLPYCPGNQTLQMQNAISKVYNCVAWAVRRVLQNKSNEWTGLHVSHTLLVLRPHILGSIELMRTTASAQDLCIIACPKARDQTGIYFKNITHIEIDRRCTKR